MLIFAAAAVMVGAFVFFRYLPLRARNKGLKEQKALKILQVSEQRARSGQIPLLEAQLEELRAVVGDYEAKIPTDRALGPFLSTIADLMNRHNLTEQVITPEQQVPAEQLTCIPVKMQCKGRLAELFGFFDQLQKLQRLIRIERVKLTNDPEFSGQVSMETRAVVYYAGPQQQG